MRDLFQRRRTWVERRFGESGLKTYLAMATFAVAPSLLLSGCEMPRAQPPPMARALGASAPYLSPAHLFAAVDSPSRVLVDAVDDGTKMFLIAGARVAVEPSGTVRHSDDRFIGVGPVSVRRLPERLGGGYLFSSVDGALTSLWRGKSFTGQLEPLLTLTGNLPNVDVGFDRLYVHGDAHMLAVDTETGAIVDQGSLPPSPSYQSMVFADAWLGAVKVPFRGVLVSFDAGVSWHSVAGATDIALYEGRLLLETGAGMIIVLPDGATRALSAEEFVEHQRSLEKQARADRSPGMLQRKSFGRLLQREAILRGVPASSTTAHFVSGGTLYTLRLSDAKILRRQHHVVPERAICEGLRFGEGTGFLCTLSDRSTRIYRLVKGGRLEERARFTGPRVVSGGGRPGLLVHGGCSAEAPADPELLCLLGQRRSQELRLSGAGLGERVVWESASRVVSLRPPGPKDSGRLLLFSLDGKRRELALKLPEQPEVRELLRTGMWLDGLEADGGQLLGWVAGHDTFVGVSISVAGRVRVGKIRHGVSRWLMSGRFAMVGSEDQGGWETIDAGATWHETELVAPDEVVVGEMEQGCSRVGCAFGQWLRVGWLAKRPRGSVAVKRPDIGRAPLPGGDIWGLRCAATRDVSAPAVGPLPGQRRRLSALSRLTRGPQLPGSEENHWFPFFEHDPPELGADQHGVSAGTGPSDSAAFLYVWGPRGKDWSGAGRSLLRVVDPFTAKGGVWSTLESPSPWNNASDASRALGYLGGSDFWVEPDPGGAGALLLTRDGSQAQLVVAEKNRVLRGIGVAGMERVLGGVRLNDGWYLGSTKGHTFSVFAIRAHGIVEVARFELGELSRAAGAKEVRLVRSFDSQRLAILLRADTWYLYPIEPGKASAGAPWVIPPDAFSELPDVCGSGAAGFVVDYPLPVSPNVEMDAGVEIRGVRARVVVGPGDVCIEGLAARSTDPLPSIDAKAVPGGAAVPLVVAEPGSAGRRRRFECKSMFKAPALNDLQNR